MSAGNRSEPPPRYSTWQPKGGGWYSNAPDTDATLFKEQDEAVAECWRHHDAHTGYVAAIAALREAEEMVKFVTTQSHRAPGLAVEAGSWLDRTAALRKERE